MTPASCSAPGCDRPAVAHGLCQAHYMRRRRGKPLERPLGSTPGPVPGEPTQPVTTHLPLRTKRALEAHAQHEALSLYALLRRIVEDWLEARRPRPR